MAEEFISEAIEPVAAGFDTGRMAAGEPGVPQEFIWRDATIRIKRIVRGWRRTGPCTHGSGEQYVRRHYYEIETESGKRMKIYFDRRAPKGRSKDVRWWLYSLEKSV